MTTLGTEWKSSKRAARSAGKPGQQSVWASWPQREVKGTEETMNLKVAVDLVWKMLSVEYAQKGRVDVHSVSKSEGQ